MLLKWIEKSPPILGASHQFDFHLSTFAFFLLSSTIWTQRFLTKKCKVLEFFLKKRTSSGQFSGTATALLLFCRRYGHFLALSPQTKNRGRQKHAFIAKSCISPLTERDSAQLDRRTKETQEPMHRMHTTRVSTRSPRARQTFVPGQIKRTGPQQETKGSCKCARG